MITIVGAGPSGSYLAYLLARGGFDVSVYEEHEKIGVPVQCTGIVTSAIKQIIRISDDFIVNRISSANIYAPNGNMLGLKLSPNLILDRTKFDLHLASMAKKAGASYFLGHKVIGIGKNSLKVMVKGVRKVVNSDLTVGADGPMSQVAKSADLFNNREFFTGLQARVELRNNNVVEFYPGTGDFAWVVPESSKVVRIGLLARKDIADEFDRFMTKRIGKGFEDKIIDRQAGLVPIYNPKLATQKNNVRLLGDAATMVKATTGGGIVQGLAAAECLADSIINGSDYQSNWKSRIGKDLYFSLIARKVMNQFSVSDYDRLVEFSNTGGMRKLLKNYDRDNLTGMLPGLILEMIKNPKMFYFTKFLFKHNIYI